MLWIAGGGLEAARERNEFRHLAGDGLVKQARKNVGQVDYRKSKAMRDSVVLNGVAAKRCVFQIRGTT